MHLPGVCSCQHTTCNQCIRLLLEVQHELHAGGSWRRGSGSNLRLSQQRTYCYRTEHRPPAERSVHGCMPSSSAQNPHPYTLQTGLVLCLSKSCLTTCLQVLAQRQLLERLFQHDMGLPEERLRRSAAMLCCSCSRMDTDRRLSWTRRRQHCMHCYPCIRELSMHACMHCRSVSYAGDPERLHRVLHKLIRGDAITVSTVGGSVTGGPCMRTDALLCMHKECRVLPTNECMQTAVLNMHAASLCQMQFSAC